MMTNLLVVLVPVVYSYSAAQQLLQKYLSTVFSAVYDVEYSDASSAFKLGTARICTSSFEAEEICLNKRKHTSETRFGGHDQEKDFKFATLSSGLHVTLEFRMLKTLGC
jgi:hypothetical protein